MAQCWHMALWVLEAYGNCGGWQAHGGQEVLGADPGDNMPAVSDEKQRNCLPCLAHFGTLHKSHNDSQPHVMSSGLARGASAPTGGRNNSMDVSVVRSQRRLSHAACK